MGQPGDLWTQIRALQENVLDLQALCGVQREQIDLLIARGDLQHAHIENLIERVYELEKENNGVACTCGYGGQHEPANPRCARNQRAEMIAGGEIDDPIHHQTQG